MPPLAPLLVESNKKIIAEYCVAHGFFSYNALSLKDDPVKTWIGREVKKFLAEAHVHLPFLLRVAASPIDVDADSTPAEAEGAGMTFDDNDPYKPDDEDIQAEEDADTLLERNAGIWDNFLDWVRDIQSEWDPADTDAYREKRAVSWFNHARRCSRDLYQLKPTMQTWVPHIACNIVTRQIILMGDPSRRSADSCESFGAMLKKIIKHLTCRRHTHTHSIPHNARSGGKSWHQTFKKGYIEQAMGRTTVRCGILLHGAANAPYRGRKESKLIKMRAVSQRLPSQCTRLSA